MIPETPLERTDVGLTPAGDGWFVVNARDARWIRRDGRGELLPFTGWWEQEASAGALDEDGDEPYARFPESEPTRYRDGWLPS